MFGIRDGDGGGASIQARLIGSLEVKLTWFGFKSHFQQISLVVHFVSPSRLQSSRLSDLAVIARFVI